MSDDPDTEGVKLNPGIQSTPKVKNVSKKLSKEREYNSIIDKDIKIVSNMATDLWDEHKHAESATEESLAAAGDAEERREPKLKWCVMQCGGEECDGYRGDCGVEIIVDHQRDWYGNCAQCQVPHILGNCRLHSARIWARTWSWWGNVIVARDEWMDMATNCCRWENNSWSAGTCQVVASSVLVPVTRELGGNARELGPNGSTRAGEQKRARGIIGVGANVPRTHWIIRAKPQYNKLRWDIRR
ncbi:hypothetical protein B0H14DRAFT_2654267 [Mycena olivaceomarginata]|nr:hypothetical protein B0H14DRAFT_2654267 [Mycena olivaceomarginata]